MTRRSSILDIALLLFLVLSGYWICDLAANHTSPAREFKPQEREDLEEQAVILGLLVLPVFLLSVAKISRLWPELNILGAHIAGSSTRQPIRLPTAKRLGAGALYINDPLAYLILRVWNPSSWTILGYGVFFGLGLHFILATIDGTLYHNQPTLIETVVHLLRGQFGVIAETFRKWPTGYEKSAKEYFANDYYGLIVNGIVNPLTLVIVVRIYRQFQNFWAGLFRGGALKGIDNAFADELRADIITRVSKPWYFWFCSVGSLLITFSVWYGLSNVSSRASYLDFGQGLVPVYHGLYLCLVWYVVSMAVLKCIVCTSVIRQVFQRNIKEGRVKLVLRPLAPDGCAGLSPLGKYAILLQVFVLLQGGSTLLRYKWGIHLTQVTPRCSMWLRGGLPARFA